MSKIRFNKGKYFHNLISEELFERFLNAYPEYKSVVNIQGLKRYWDLITEELRAEISTNKLGVVLNKSMGELKVQYLPYNCVASNFQVGTKEDPIDYSNILTKGKKFKVIWERKSAARYNGILNIYAFEPCNLLIRQSREEALKRPGDLRTARPKMIRTQFSKNISND